MDPRVVGDCTRLYQVLDAAFTKRKGNTVLLTRMKHIHVCGAPILSSVVDLQGSDFALRPNGARSNDVCAIFVAIGARPEKERMYLLKLANEEVQQRFLQSVRSTWLT